MRFVAISLLPGQLETFFASGVVGTAINDGKLALDCLNPRDFAENKHRRVDDRPFGGGPGMVLSYQPLAGAIGAAKRLAPNGRVIGLTPQGRKFAQRDAAEIAAAGEVILVCGRYEGYDERVADQLLDDEISIGDFVMSGGEIAAAAVIDTVSRLVPGVLGHEESAGEDSFSAGLLDWPHYTRPEEIDGSRVPDVLLSGDHKAIARWRRREALGRTALRRPEMLTDRALELPDQQLLDEYLAAAAAVDKT